MACGSSLVGAGPQLLLVAAEQAEKIHVAGYQHATLSAIVKHGRMVKVPVQSAQSISFADYRDVNDGIVFGVGRNHGRSRPGEYQLCDLLCLKVAEVFGHLVVGEPGCRPYTLVVEDPFQFLK